MTSDPLRRLLFGDEPVRIPLDHAVETLAESWFLVLEALPEERNRDLVYVDVELADTRRARPPRRFHFFFGMPDSEDAYNARVDNVEGAVVVSDTYSWPATGALPGFSLLDPTQVEVSLGRALELADENLGSPIAEAGPPDLNVSVGLRNPEGAPVWELRFDYWPEDGPAMSPVILVHGRSGRVTKLR